MNTNDIKDGAKIMADKIKDKSNLVLCAKAVCGDRTAWALNFTSGFAV